MDFFEKCTNALYASIIGDALGVPVESSTRQELALCSVKNMLGYGRYDQPEGTWSDDTSMILCTMDSLTRGYSLEDLGREFCSWLFEGKWTSSGYAFDAGITTVTSLENLRSMISPHESGGASEDDNGNGSLMRILPAALYFAKEKTDVFLERIHEISAITHAHPRSKMGCGIYSLLIRNLLRAEKDKKLTYNYTLEEVSAFYSKYDDFSDELTTYERILNNDLPSLEKDKIYSSGYIVHTLEAAIWCFMNRNTTKDILLEAVNLGLDTDTTGTVAGGLAGVLYGLSEVPEEWLNTLSQKESIDELVRKFVNILSPLN